MTANCDKLLEQLYKASAVLADAHREDLEPALSHARAIIRWAQDFQAYFTSEVEDFDRVDEMGEDKS